MFHPDQQLFPTKRFRYKIIRPVLFEAQAEKRRQEQQAKRDAEEAARRKAAEEKEEELARIRAEKRAAEQERLAAEKRALENRRQTELTGLRQYLEVCINSWGEFCINVD